MLSGPHQEPTMTPHHTALVRSSFERVAPIADQAAALFYDELFSLAPSLRPLFIGDLRSQGAKLMQMIGAAVRLLDRPEALLPVLAQLGARHAGYGVQARDYHVVGVALINTLAKGLGDAFDQPTREAWAAMYALVSSTMIAAANAERVSV
jgi:hemoglobin-like flavoprotein